MNIPQELAEQFARGNGAIFVGEGLSIDAELPGWADLVCELTAEVDGCPPDADYRDIAQYYEIEQGRNWLVQRLRDRLDTLDVYPTSVHKALVKLPVPVIFTTNYDDLLEQALRTAKRRFTSVIGNVHASFWSADRLQLVKLRGDLDQQESLVITAEDYERFAVKCKSLADILKVTLQTHTVLFLGYSAADPDLRLILTQAREESGEFARNLYTVQFGPPRMTVKILERRGLKVIDLDKQPDANARTVVLYEWLQELERQIQMSGALGETVVSQRKAKSNLPPLGGELVGRDREIEQLMAWLRKGKSPLVIEGVAGMGKSALATTVAYACCGERLFDAFIWWSARYEARPMEELLDQVGRSLGHRTDSGQPTYNSVEGTYGLLRQHKCLLIVNKVTQIQHVEILDFLNGVPPPTCVLLTTTSPIPFGRHITIGPLDTAASLELIRVKTEELECRNLMGISDDQLETLCEASGGSPVALALSVGLAKKGRHLDRIIQDLRSGAGRFSALCADAYTMLPESVRDALHLICISRESISGEALERILQASRTTLEDEWLVHLRDMALIVEQFADTWAGSRFAPSNRLVREYYNAAIRINQPEEDRRLRDAAAAYYYEECRLKGYENWSGYDWIEENLQEISATLDWYDQTHQWPSLVEMMKAIYYFLGTRGYWRERLDYGDRAAQAARQSGDRKSEAEILVRGIGWTETQLGEYTKASEDIWRGLKISEEIADNGGLASAYRYLGTIERRQGNFEQAESFYQQAISYAKLAPDSARLIAGIEISLGTMYLKTGRLAKCEQQLKEALSTFRKLDHKSKVAGVLSRLGDVKLKQGQIEEAERFYRESEDYAQQINRPKTRGYNLLGLARIAHRRSDHTSARELAQQARIMFGNLGIADETAEVADLLRLIEQ
jgi:tetratricopeptide (TPR) repeat protein